MPGTSKYPVEVRRRAVRRVAARRGGEPSQWAAIRAVAGEVGVSAETLRLWVRRDEADRGGGGTSGARAAAVDRQRVRELERTVHEREREVRELRRANRVLASALAFFRRELDPRPARS